MIDPIQPTPLRRGFLLPIFLARTGVKMARGWAGRVATRRVCAARDVGEERESEGARSERAKPVFEEGEILWSDLRIVSLIFVPHVPQIPNSWNKLFLA